MYSAISRSTGLGVVVEADVALADALPSPPEILMTLSAPFSEATNYLSLVSILACLFGLSLLSLSSVEDNVSLISFIAAVF